MPSKNLIEKLRELRKQGWRVTVSQTTRHVGAGGVALERMKADGTGKEFITVDNTGKVQDG